jgi:membrane-associated phospholipid phosphatase
MNSLRITSLLASVCLAAPTLAAQTKDSTTTQKTFFTRGDAVVSGVAFAASVGVSHFDERIAAWARSPSVQGGDSRHDLMEKLTVVNEVPLTIGAVAVYGIGRVVGSDVTTEVGLHATEALVLTVVASEMIRTPLGRTRPRESQADAYKFTFCGGFTDFAKRSYPSLHAAVAFATASVLTGELHHREPGAVPYVAPVLYAAAMIPGITRMYLDQHWASDVVAGAFLGTLLGSRVVSYSYSHRPSRLERSLLASRIGPGGHGRLMISAGFGTTVIPDGHGGLMIVKTISN